MNHLPFSLNILVVMLLGVSACSSKPAPNYIYGNYYLAGDDDCKRARFRTNNSIFCFNKDGQQTGVRFAISQQEVAAYNQRKEQERREFQAAIQGFNNQVNNMNQNTARLQQSIQTMDTSSSRNTQSAPNNAIRWGDDNSRSTDASAIPRIQLAPDLPAHLSNDIPIPATAIYGECLGSWRAGHCVGVFKQTEPGEYICFIPLPNGECSGPVFRKE